MNPRSISAPTLASPSARQRVLALFAGLVLFAGACTTAAQRPTTQLYDPSQTGKYAQRSGGFDGTADEPMAEKRLRAINAARQKALEADTVKLLNLAKELNAEIAAASSGTLDPIQLRKLNEIEKLAHSIREKMSTSVRPNPAFAPMGSPQYR